MLKNNIESCSKHLTFNPKGSRSSDVQTPIRAIKQKRKIVISTAKRVDRQKIREDTETGSKYQEDKENSQRYMNCFEQSEVQEHSHFYMQTSRDFGYEQQQTLQQLVDKFKKQASNIHKGFVKMIRVSTKGCFDRLKQHAGREPHKGVNRQASVRRNTNTLDILCKNIVKLCFRTFMGCLHMHTNRVLDQETRSIELYYRKRQSQLNHRQKILAARMIVETVRQIGNRKLHLSQFVMKFMRQADATPRTSRFCLPQSKPRQHHKSYSFSTVEPE